MVALIYPCVAIILLVPNVFVGQERGVYSQEQRSRHEQPTEGWRRWQWYLNDTAVSMNVKSAWRAGYTGKGILVAVVDDGVKMDHPDLKSNFNLTASYDFLDDRNISTNHNPSRHGTKCAGIIAGENNTKCGVGVAFRAQVSSIRLFDDDTHSTDQSEAKALSFKRDIIDIYSNSWGAGDRGWEVTGPGPQLKKALEKGTRLGRRGKGSIFVFAAGNGGVSGDSCAFSGYVNNIHTIAISGVNWDGSVPAYTEQCAAIMAVTYGQDMFRYESFVPPLITTEGASDCTDKFPGSSATAAMASGIIALALQANPQLTWRDVQHLIARSSKPLNPPRWRVNRYRAIWTYNAVGLAVSSHYGFGLMDASKMTEYAKYWHSVPEQLSCVITLDVSDFNSSRLVIPSRGNLGLALPLSRNNCSIQYLEHVQTEVNLNFTSRGYLEMFLTSPNGTQSKLLYSRRMDGLMGYKNFTNWRVTSLHYWGETPFGDWTITIRNAKPRNGEGRVFGLKLILYGTKNDPLANNKHVNNKAKQIETVNIFLRRNEMPIHGRYSQWSRWGRCIQNIQHRSRVCNNPSPVNGRRDCSGLGPDTQSRRCRWQGAPINGGYSKWNPWTPCTLTCAGGVQQRFRSCTNPPPANEGMDCSGLGQATESRMCNKQNCPTCTNTADESRCLTWYNNEGCSNPTVKQWCKKTCGGCQACTNILDDSSCQQWQNNGNGCSYPAVKDLCKKTCGSC